MSIGIGKLASKKFEGTEALANEAGSKIQSGRANSTGCNGSRTDGGGSSGCGDRSRKLGQSGNDE